MEIRVNSPLDMHLHLRDGDMLRSVAKYSSKAFAGALIMPNIVPPITSKDEILSYKNRIMEVTKDDNFRPYMSIFFKDCYDFNFLNEIKDLIIIIKLYPAGVTTNSDGGVSGFDLEKLRTTLEAMSELNIPLSIHCETNGFVLDREVEFIPILKSINRAFPKLKIIFEHISTAKSVEFVLDSENIFATISLHHITITLDDLLGGGLKPHLFCKPIVKTQNDRDRLLELALSANPKVMFGSDSAPHLDSKKLTFNGSAGIFSAPILLPKLVEIFHKHNSLENLDKFLSLNAQSIYNITPPEKTTVLENCEFEVAKNYEDITPIFAGEKIGWSIKSVL